MKRSNGKKQLNDLKRIEDLLESTNKKDELVNKTKQIQKVHKQNIDQNEINFDTIKMSDHGYIRSKERFNKDKNEALPYFRSKLKVAKKIGKQISEQGNPAILYAIGRIGIYVSTDYKEIVTVIKQESVTYEPIKEKVRELHAKEIRKIKRKEYTCKRRLEDDTYNINVELAQLKLRHHKSRSESVKLACQARMNALDIYIKEKEEEIVKLQKIRKQIEKSMISVI